MSLTLKEARKRNPSIVAAPARGADHRHPFAIQIVCRECGSEHVSRDASARWSTATQQWELSGVQDQGSCDDCGEVQLVERFTDSLGNDLGPIDESQTIKGETLEDWLSGKRQPRELPEGL